MRLAVMVKQANPRQRIMPSAIIMTCFSILLAASPAHARSQMVLYEGKTAVIEGRGGTKIHASGVDFWMTGAPPKRYSVLALITDERGAGSVEGDAIGAHSIAAKVKEAGGDAAIIMRQSSENTGNNPGIDAIGKEIADCRSNCSAPHEQTTTKMMVVKYLAP